MRAKCPFFAELRPPRLDCLVECSPIPLVLLFVYFCFDPLPPDMKPECTTVIELELGATPPRDAGPTLLVWVLLSTALPPGPNILWSSGRRFSCPVAGFYCLKLSWPVWEPKLLFALWEEELTPRGLLLLLLELL